MLAIALGGYVVMFAVVVSVFYTASKTQVSMPPIEPREPLEFKDFDRARTPEKQVSCDHFN
jgi:hypothetical protein